MSDDLVKRLRWMGHEDTEAGADRIEALTEQLEAARADAKEAEAYAEELEKERDTAREYAGEVRTREMAAENARISATDKLAKAVELLKEARQDLEEYVTHEWPKDEHPVYERKWERDMELCRRIDATLAEIEGKDAP
jgi:chromosome segregation ATPase